MKRFDKILRGFNSTIAKLDKLVESNQFDYERNNKVIDYYQARISQVVENSNELLAESAAAENVAAKIRALIA